MTSRDKIFYVLAGCVLVASLVVLGASGYELTKTPDESGEQQPVLVSKLPAQPSIPAPLSADHYAGLYQRPLFTPDRRSVQVQVIDKQNIGLAAAGPLPLSLVGVIIGNGKRLAMVKRTSSGEVALLSPGDATEGWTVKEVNSNSVLLLSGAKQQLIQLPDKE